MTHSYTLYSSHLSYFAGIARAYLRCKNLDFEDRIANAFDLAYRIPRAVGVGVVPVIETDKGEWLQDSYSIMNELERRHPENPMIPSTPKQLIAARLIEAWSTEYWFAPGVHWRWHYPKNREIFELEIPRDMVPFAPFLAKPLASALADAITKQVGTGLGVRAENTEIIESWTLKICDILEEHFATHKYLLGSRPSIADFALCGPFYGHFSRDPASRQILMLPRPNLLAWVDRTHGGAHYDGDWLADDEIPETLTPIFHAIMNELLPMGEAVAKEVTKYKSQSPARNKRIMMAPLQLMHYKLNKKQQEDPNIVPRLLKTDITYPMGNHTMTAAARPFVAYKLQTLQEEYEGLSTEQKSAVEQWLQQFNEKPIPNWDFGPKMAKENVVTRFVD